MRTTPPAPSSAILFPRAAALAAALCALAGCATGPESRYYVFEPTGALRSMAARDAKASACTIQLAPVQVPAYLDRPQIVTRLSATEIRADQFNRWGNPIAVSAAEMIGATIGEVLPDAYVDLRPDPARHHDDYEVQIDLLRLDGLLAGSVELLAEWRVLRPGRTNAVVAQRLSRHIAEARPADADGAKVAAGRADYDAYLAALRGNLEALGREIAAAIKQDR